MVYFPLASVMEPILRSGTETVAPITGLPSALSVTVPDKVPKTSLPVLLLTAAALANTEKVINMKAKQQNSFNFIMFSLNSIIATGAHKRHINSQQKFKQKKE